MPSKQQLLKNTKLIARNSFSIVLVIILWEIGAKLNLFNPNYFPPPSRVLERLFFLIKSNHYGFTDDIKFSFYRFFIGTVIAVPPAIIMGVCISLNRYLAYFFNPLIAITYPSPKMAIFPLLLLLFGIDDAPKIMIIAIGIFYLVLINTILGIKRLTSSEFIDVVNIYKIPNTIKLLKIYLRGALPEILTGMKLGMGYGLVMIVTGEFTISKNGIGLFIWVAWEQFRPIDLYCGLYVLSLTGILIFFTIDKLINTLEELKN